MGFIFFIVSMVLGWILIPMGVIWGFVEAFVKRGFKSSLKRLNKYFFDIAISIDQLGNVACKELFNDVLIRYYSKNRFGNPDETVSSVLGKNKRDNTLTVAGNVLERILHFLDKNHSINSIEQ